VFSQREQDTKLKVINYTFHRDVDSHYSAVRQSGRNDIGQEEHTRVILLATSAFSVSFAKAVLMLV
jgi:hypothetical protein